MLFDTNHKDILYNLLLILNKGTFGVFYFTTYSDLFSILFNESIGILLRIVSTTSVIDLGNEIIVHVTIVSQPDREYVLLKMIRRRFNISKYTHDF